jgi:O-antigen/teichoic acid export membrane protein
MRARDTAIVSGGLLTQQIMVFLTGVLIARTLGSSIYGTIGTLKSLTTFMLIVTPLGLDLALLKHAAFYQDRPAELRTISSSLRGIVAALNICILLVVMIWIGPWLQDIYKIENFAYLCVIAMIGVIFAADVQLSSALYRVADKTSLYAIIAYYGQSIIRFGLSSVAIVLGSSVEIITWINVISFAFTVIALGRGESKSKWLPVPLIELVRKIVTIVSESLWMAGALLIGQSMRFVDVMLLAALSSASTVGQYVAMSSVAQLIQIYPSAIAVTLGPRIASMYRVGDRNGIIQALQSYFRQGSLLGGYLFAGVAVFGCQLNLIFGHGFQFSWPLAGLLAFGWYVGAILGPLGYLLSMTGHHRRELVITVLGAMVLIVCLYVFIPLLLDVGAALSVAVTFIVVNLMRWSWSTKLLRKNPMQFINLLPPISFSCVALSCYVMGTALLGHTLSGLIVECVGYSILSAIVYYMSFAPENEKKRLIRQYRVLVDRRIA